jgi:hypothetical protein
VEELNEVTQTMDPNLAVAVHQKEPWRAEVVVSIVQAH